MPPKFYILGDRPFASKDLIQNHLAKIKSEALLGQPVLSEHLPFLMDLLSHHPDWQQKSAKMSYLIVANKSQLLSNGRYATDRCFFVIYQDGSTDDISAAWALKHLSPAHKQPLISGRNYVA